VSAVRTMLESIPALLPAARAIRRWPERALHPVRRLAARRRVAACLPLRRVVVLCHGNVCRSPYGEAVLRRLLHEGANGPAIIESAGFIGPGRPSPPLALKVAGQRGSDLSGHQSRLVGRDVVAGADLVVVMSTRQAHRVRRELGVARGRVLVLGDLDPRRITTREIRDPEGQAEDVFRGSYDRIDRCLAAFVSIARRSAVQPSA
jgi:protein-tyrosine phosphatase